MKYELEKLEVCVNKWASENVAVIAEKEIAEFQQDAWATQKAIIHNLLLQKNETLLNTYFSVHMQKLVDLCDRLFGVAKLNTSHPLIIALLDLLGALKRAAPTLIDRNLALPKAFRLIQGEVLHKEWKTLLPGFRDMGFSNELLENCGSPF